MIAAYTQYGDSLHEHSAGLREEVRCLVEGTAATTAGSDSVGFAKRVSNDALTPLHDSVRKARAAHRELLRVLGNSEEHEDAHFVPHVISLTGGLVQALTDDLATRTVCLNSLRRCADASVCDDTAHLSRSPYRMSIPAMRLTAYTALSGQPVLHGAAENVLSDLKGTVSMLSR